MNHLSFCPGPKKVSVATGMIFLQGSVYSVHLKHLYMFVSGIVIVIIRKSSKETTEHTHFNIRLALRSALACLDTWYYRCLAPAAVTGC